MEKYFLINETTGFSVFIYEKDYVGASTEINGRISFDKGSVKDILEPIRGTGLSLQLQADSNLTFDEFSEADEKTYTVAVTKNGSVFFQGFLKPDGITQSFVQDLWIVNLDFVDGLGVLKDLAFVNSAGNNFVGKLSMFEIIQGCLARTGLTMTINSSVKLKYLGYTGANILNDTYLNADRFFKIDAQASQGGTTMTCEEVLNSVLNIISACITQQDGAWWIYRPNEFEDNVVFLNHSTFRTFTKNLSITVGSQIDNFYPHHCNGNQQIETKGAISAYRINYKYGFKSGIFDNGSLQHDDFLNYPNWTVNPPYFSKLINDPLSGIGMKIITNEEPSYYLLATSNEIPVLVGANFNFVITHRANGNATFVYAVRIGIYYFGNIGFDTWGWSTTPNYYGLSYIPSLGTDVNEIQTSPIPVSGDIYIEIYVPEVMTGGVFDPNDATICEVVNINLVPLNSDAKIGEFHTITRNISPSSITKENQEVFNGDSSNLLIGSIYKQDKSTLTTLWTRIDWVEEKRILQISGEDDMRISQKPQKVFIGDFYGYVPYLSIVSINNLIGKFMFIEHSYDTDTNITKGKLKQFYTNEVGDLEYSLTYDYGNTVKPSIRS